MRYLIQGIILGLSYLAPIGAQNLFMINTALTQRKKRALLTALIVVFFDVTLALGCFFGVGAIIDRFMIVRLIILCIGSIILIYIGYGLIRTDKISTTTMDTNITLWNVVRNACIVTWFNPQAIIDGSLMLGAFRTTLLPEQSLKFILGVTSASFLWFFGITFLMGLVRDRFNEKVMILINKICGIVIVFYGLKLFLNFCKIIQNYL